MSTVRDLHNQAMDLVERAILERIRGNMDVNAQLHKEALELELAAIAEMDKYGETAEPTWSVLHRSAGWMAFNSNQYRRAEQIASKALAGEPHPEIAEELRELLEQTNFHRHLELNGAELGVGEIQLSLVGHSVASGMMILSDLVGRMDSFQKLVYRIAQRRVHGEYKSQIPKNIQRGYRVFTGVPRVGSFAIALRLAHPHGQPSSSRMPGTDEIIDEFMDLMDLVNSSRVEAIQERIPDPKYLDNFFGLAKKIAPDGDRIRQVGFTSIRHGEEHSVEFVRPAAEINSQPAVRVAPPRPAEPRPLIGAFLGVDVTLPNNDLIKVIDDYRKTYKIYVPKGRIDDFVLPLWRSRVAVTYTRRGNRMILEDINPLETS